LVAVDGVVVVDGAAWKVKNRTSSAFTGRCSGDAVVAPWCGRFARIQAYKRQFWPPQNDDDDDDDDDDDIQTTTTTFRRTTERTNAV